MCKKSESISKLAIALVKAQSDIKSVSKDGANPHFKSKYATLDNIIDETRPILAKHGLAILQMPGGDGENVIMRTLLMHESGEWLETEPLVMRPVKNDPQGMGSCITYARRYSYSALLSISTDEDDDGNGASHPPQGYNNRNYQNTSQSQERTSQSAASSERLATEGQVKLLRVKMRAAGFETMDQINSFLSMELESIADLPMAKVNEIIKFLDEQKLPA